MPYEEEWSPAWGDWCSSISKFQIDSDVLDQIIGRGEWAVSGCDRPRANGSRVGLRALSVWMMDVNVVVAAIGLER